MSDEPDVDTLGIKALRELISSAGLSYEDCIEKSDLRARAREALEVKKSKPPPAAASASSGGTREFGGYSCIVKGPADLLAGDASAAPADLLVICLHGLGATNTDLAEVPSVLASYDQSLGKARIVCVFPQAPMGPMGSAWWQFDAMGFMQAQMTPAGPQREALVAKLIRTEPSGLGDCRQRMSTLIAESRKFAGNIPPSKICLMGFSLGAITALDLALQQPEGEGIGGVVFMNGAPIVVDQWAERLEKAHKGIKVYLTGGLADMTLPNECSGWVLQLLQAKGANVVHKYHPGGHEIGGPDILTAISRFVAGLL